MDRQFIRWCLGFHPVYQLVRPLHRCLLSRYRRFIRRCPLFSYSFSFWHLINRLSSQFDMWYFGILGNNMVSPIDHVVMNHQNYTRTNGTWGHVHYNLPLFGDLWQHNQSKHIFCKSWQNYNHLHLLGCLPSSKLPLDQTSTFVIFSSYVHT
jgi:hypothetical protein